VEARLVMPKLHVIFLRDDLRVGLLPCRNAAGVVAVGMRKDDVFDGARVFGLQQLFMSRGVEWHRGVDDHIARFGHDHERVAEADGLIDRFAELERFLLIPSGAERIVAHLSLLREAQWLNRQNRDRKGGGGDRRERFCATHRHCPPENPWVRIASSMQSWAEDPLGARSATGPEPRDYER